MQLADKLRPEHTALIIVDMQNDFCAPDGVMARKGKDVSAMSELVKRQRSIVEICEAKGIPVLFTQLLYNRAKLNDLQKEQYDLDGKLVTCDIHGDGWKFFGFNPSERQTYPKYSYNIFSNKRLCRDLRALHIKTLIIAGVSTQICVETAIRNGFDLGYKIVLPEDLVATTSNDPETQKRTLMLVQKTYGVVTNSRELAQILTQSAS
jgi:ureidoacrylate peracid hydrolase